MVKLSCRKTINHAPEKGVVTYMIPLRKFLNLINLNS